MNTLTEKIRNSLIGQRRLISTPFGEKPLVYADYTASGRSLGFIEDYIRDQVLPYYANTHTEATFTGARTTALRESARRAIRRAVNGTDDDKVIFCGSGATAAINRLIDVLNLRLPADLDSRCELSAVLPDSERPVVFIGPYEHHSNELPWRESIALLEVIPLDSRGGIDAEALELALSRHQHRSLLIGSFSAASNVTGIKSDVPGLTALLKRFGALACWDYAAAGPYLGIDMNGSVPLDAIFLSPHKFVGGPGTPGVLVAKRHLFRNRVPATIGGGTVSYVTPLDHVYIEDVERREEGGTPAIIEAIRAGLVFSLQQQVGVSHIQAREEAMAAHVMKRLESIPDIEVLGSTEADRLPIFSLRFRHGNRELHYGFVTVLLNDLFGIQVRGGCSCAGPYAHHLLGMDMNHSRRIEEAVKSGISVMRPGWVRLNFNYFIDDEELDYLLGALELVARYGWRLLSHYEYDSDHGVWRHRNQGRCPGSEDPVFEINWLDVGKGECSESCTRPLAETLEVAGHILRSSTPPDTTAVVDIPSTFEDIRWFVSPRETRAESESRQSVSRAG